MAEECLLNVTVPEGVETGQILTVTAPDGVHIQVAVPEAAPAGTVFTISYKKPFVDEVPETPQDTTTSTDSSTSSKTEQETSTSSSDRRIKFAPDVAGNERKASPTAAAASNNQYRYRQSEMIPASAQKSGLLQKCNRHGKWQKRYFRSEGNYLKYFKKESSTNMLGVIDLRQVTAVESMSTSTAPHAFVLKGAGGSNILSLSSTTVEDRDSWTRFLASLIKERNTTMRKQSVQVQNSFVDNPAEASSQSLTYTYPTQKGSDTVIDASGAKGSAGSAPTVQADNLPHKPFPNPFEKVVVLLVRDPKVGLGLFMDSEGAAPTFGCWVEHMAAGSPAADSDPPIFNGDGILDINGQSTSMLDLALIGQLMQQKTVRITLLRQQGQQQRAPRASSLFKNAKVEQEEEEGAGSEAQAKVLLQAATGAPVTSALLEQARAVVDDTAEEALTVMLGGEEVKQRLVARLLQLSFLRETAESNHVSSTVVETCWEGLNKSEGGGVSGLEGWDGHENIGQWLAGEELSVWKAAIEARHSDMRKVQAALSPLASAGVRAEAEQPYRRVSTWLMEAHVWRDTLHRQGVDVPATVVATRHDPSIAAATSVTVAKSKATGRRQSVTMGQVGSVEGQEIERVKMYRAGNGASGPGAVSGSQFEGVLLKRSRHGKWQKRYFRSEGNYLKYYKRADSGSMLGVIDLRQVFSVDGFSTAKSPYSFSLKGQNGTFTIMTMGANSEASRAKWLEHFTAVCREHTPASSMESQHPEVEHPFFKLVVTLVRSPQHGFGLHLDSDGDSPTFSCWLEWASPGSPAATCDPPLLRGDMILDINGRNVNTGSRHLVAEALSQQQVRLTLVRSKAAEQALEQEESEASEGFETEISGVGAADETIDYISEWLAATETSDTQTLVRPRKVLWIGPPGCGKGTQCARLHEQFGLQHISSGDMLRSAVADKTELGLKAERYIQAGELVPDQLVIDLILQAMEARNSSSLNITKHGGWMLDGFPRTAEQAKALLRAGVVPDVVFFLACSEDELIKRARERGREDDGEETVRQRLKIYAEHEAGLRSFFRDSTGVNPYAKEAYYGSTIGGGCISVVSVSADRDPDDVSMAVVDALVNQGQKLNDLGEGVGGGAVGPMRTELLQMLFKEELDAAAADFKLGFVQQQQIMEAFVDHQNIHGHLNRGALIAATAATGQHLSEDMLDDVMRAAGAVGQSSVHFSQFLRIRTQVMEEKKILV